MHIPTLSNFEGSTKQTVEIHLHPGRLTWNLQITHLERKMICQTIIFRFHVNLPGCILKKVGSQKSIGLSETKTTRVAVIGDSHSPYGRTWLLAIILTARGMRGRGPPRRREESHGAKATPRQAPWKPARMPKPDHPWDWYIYLHEWLILMVNVRKYTIHGWYG